MSITYYTHYGLTYFFAVTTSFQDVIENLKVVIKERKM